MSILSTEQLAEMRKLCDAATKGPWVREWRSVYAPCPLLSNPHTNTEMVCDCVSPAEGDFIAAARTALPDALDTIEQLQRELATAKIAAWREAAKIMCPECLSGSPVGKGQFKWHHEKQSCNAWEIHTLIAQAEQELKK